MRVGIGLAQLSFDPGGVLMLGGVKVPGAWGLRGRTDGDVLLHAISDALLGAAVLGDLNDHVPTDDPNWRDVPSAVLVAEVLARLQAKGLRPLHVDATLVTDRADVDGLRGAMRERIGAVLGLDPAHVSVKRAPTGGLGALGGGAGMAALATVAVSEAGA